ncbi:MAG: DUF6145 family protein [Lachnospiraceae bacterium]
MSDQRQEENIKEEIKKEKVGDEGRMADGRMVLCAANKYEMKYFFNKTFQSLPESIQNELHIISVLFAQEVGGIFKIVFEEDGDVTIETEAAEDDVLYDDISAGLMVAEIKRTRQEMFESLSLYYKVFILKENPGELLEEEE